MKSSASSGSSGMLKIALVSLIFIGISVTPATAQNRTVNGVIIGAAVGSVVGLKQYVGKEEGNP